MTTNAELAAALAFVLRKWKDAGGTEADTKPFDELLARVKEEPPAPPPAPIKAHEALDDEPPRKRRQSNDPRLAELDAEIDRLNRETD